MNKTYRAYDKEDIKSILNLIKRKLDIAFDKAEAENIFAEISFQIKSAIELEEKAFRDETVDLLNKIGITMPFAKIKKRILFICSNPQGKNPLDFSKELRILRDLEKKGHFELIIETSVLGAELFNLIREASPDLVHISLHGSKTKGLYFENLHGKEYLMKPEELAEQFELIAKKQTIECIFLSACNSLQYAEPLKPFVENIITAKDFIPESIAIAFSKAFYEEICHQKNKEKDYAFAFKRGQLFVKHQIEQGEIELVNENDYELLTFL